MEVFLHKGCHAPELVIGSKRGNSNDENAQAVVREGKPEDNLPRDRQRYFP